MRIAAQTETEQHASKQASKQAHKQARKYTSKQASKQAHKQARTQASKQSTKQASKQLGTRRRFSSNPIRNSACQSKAPHDLPRLAVGANGSHFNGCCRLRRQNQSCANGCAECSSPSLHCMQCTVLPHGNHHLVPGEKVKWISAFVQIWRQVNNIAWLHFCCHFECRAQQAFHQTPCGPNIIPGGLPIS